MVLLKKRFLDIIHEVAPDAIEFNPSSTQQLQQLLFAPFARKKDNKDKATGNDVMKIGKKLLKKELVWESVVTDEQNNNSIEQNEEGDQGLLLPSKVDQQDDDLLKIVRNLKVVNEYPEVRVFKVEKLLNYDYSHLNLSEKEKKLKYRDMSITGFGIPAKKMSLLGLPSVDIEALKAITEGPVQKHFE